MLLATYQHHAAPRGQTTARSGEWGSELNYTATIRRTPTPQAAGTQYFAMDVDEVPAVGGSRPDRLPDVSGPQERVQRRTVQQTIDIIVPLPMLDAPVPQTVVHLEEVLRPCDIMVPEQVIEAPKITLHDVIPQRAVLPMPQMAEQLVDEPVPSFDDFELVEVGEEEEREEEEEEEELPHMVPGSRVWDADGHAWCRVVGLAGVYWWRMGTSIAQWTPPGGAHRQARADKKYWPGLRWVTCLRSCSSSSSSPSSSLSCLRFSSSPECWTFRLHAEIGTHSAKLCSRPWRSHRFRS